MKIYLAGPMTGYPKFNYPAFEYAAAKLREQGHTVFSPAERDIERDGVNWSELVPDGDSAKAAALGFDRRRALTDDFTWICEHADVVALLPGWSKGRGARAEHAVGHALGLNVWLLGREYVAA